jgi:hypothetical protein
MSDRDDEELYRIATKVEPEDQESLSDEVVGDGGGVVVRVALEGDGYGPRVSDQTLSLGNSQRSEHPNTIDHREPRSSKRHYWALGVGPPGRRIHLFQDRLWWGCPPRMIHATVRDPRTPALVYRYLTTCLGHRDAKQATRWAKKLVRSWRPGVGLILGPKNEPYWVALRERGIF